MATILDFTRLDITALAESFPSLRGKPGVRPFDATRLDAYGYSGAPGAGALSAIRFILYVWAPSQSDARFSGRFDIHEAWASWDDEHRFAFKMWAQSPWWP